MSKVRFSALSSFDVDEECIICYEEYTLEDNVTKLDCDDRHIFHNKCITEWIKSGKNSCPVCRAPIMVDNVELVWLIIKY